MRDLLTDAGFDLAMDSTAVESEFVSFLRNRTYDLILSDFTLPGFDAFAALRWCKELCPAVPFICVSGTVGEETAIEMLKRGAVDYVLKDRPTKLPSAIRRALDEAKEREARRRAAELFESQYTLLTALINSPKDLIIFSLDTNYCYTTFNEKHREEMKRVWKTEITIGMNLLDCMQIPALQDLAKQSIDRALMGESFSELQHQPDLDISYEFSWNPVYQNSEVIGVTVFIRDITERKRSEEALEKSERRLREAQEMAHLGFWDWDVKTGDVVWSDEVYKIFCLDPKTFTPQIDSILALSPWPEDNHRDQELIKRAIETRSPGAYEQKFLRPDKSIGHYYSTFQGVYDEKGDLISIAGTVLDITDRKRAEEKLSASEIRFRRLFESAKDGILILDAETGMIVDANPFLIDLLGFSQVEFRGKRLWELGLLKDLIANKEKFLELQRQEYVRYENLPLETADGQPISVEFVSNVYLVDKMKVVQCNIRNITERRRAEEKILSQLEELRRWQEVTLGREDRNRQLKHEVNELLVRLGETIRYPSQESTSDKQETEKG